MKNILCIGHAAYDITIPMDKFPEEDNKYRVDQKVECGGGPASNAAYLLGKWEMNTSFVGIVGNDIYGHKIKNEFISQSVDIDSLEISDEFETTTSFILANLKSGTRTIFTNRNKNMNLSDPEIGIKADFILLDGQELDASLNALNNNPNAISIIDAGRCVDEVIELSKKVNYLICSKKFVEGFTGIKIDLEKKEEVHQIFNILKSEFKNTIAITIGDKGVLYEKDNKIRILPALDVDVKDSTGAGDIFHGAFAYGLMNNYDFEESLKIASIAGGLSVSHIGGRYSVPNLVDVMAIYEKSK